MLFKCLVLALLVMVVRHWRSRRPKPAALGLIVFALFLLSWPPLAHLATGSLAWQYSPTDYENGHDAQVIVVLSGRVTGTGPGVVAPAAGENTFQRCRHAAWLHKQWRPLPVLASGGVILPTDGVSAASIMREVLVAEGVPASMVWTEQRSRSTYENAAFAAEILRRKGISRLLLVTEAFHMPRAQASFEKQGLTVFPAPCRFPVLRPGAGSLLPSIVSVSDTELAFHEWVGLAWYWVRGRI